MLEAIKKDYSEEVLKKACSHYNIDENTAKLIRDYSNLIYDCGDRILRLSHSSERTYEHVRIELEWQFYLQNKKLPVAKTLLLPNKKLAVKIRVGENHFTAACFEKIIGNKISTDNWDQSHFKKLGQLTGIMHKIAIKAPTELTDKIPSWKNVEGNNLYHYLPKEESDLIEIRKKLLKEFQKLPIHKSNFGIIHYDIHHGNYLIDGNNQIQLFDFEMVCNSWFVKDVANVLYYAYLHPGSDKFSKEEFYNYFLFNFWEGYEKEFNLNQQERLSVPYFLLYRDILVFAFLHKAWDLANLSELQKNQLGKTKKSIQKRRHDLKYY